MQQSCKTSEMAMVAVRNELDATNKSTSRQLTEFSAELDDQINYLKVQILSAAPAKVVEVLKESTMRLETDVKKLRDGGCGVAKACVLRLNALMNAAATTVPYNPPSISPVNSASQLTQLNVEQAPHPMHHAPEDNVSPHPMHQGQQGSAHLPHLSGMPQHHAHEVTRSSASPGPAKSSDDVDHQSTHRRKTSSDSHRHGHDGDNNSTTDSIQTHHGHRKSVSEHSESGPETHQTHSHHKKSSHKHGRHSPTMAHHDQTSPIPLSPAAVDHDTSSNVEQVPEVILTTPIKHSKHKSGHSQHASPEHHQQPSSHGRGMKEHLSPLHHGHGVHGHPASLKPIVLSGDHHLLDLSSMGGHGLSYNGRNSPSSSAGSSLSSTPSRGRKPHHAHRHLDTIRSVHSPTSPHDPHESREEEQAPPPRLHNTNPSPVIEADTTAPPVSPVPAPTTPAEKRNPYGFNEQEDDPALSEEFKKLMGVSYEAVNKQETVTKEAGTVDEDHFSESSGDDSKNGVAEVRH